MRISNNWLRELVQVERSPVELAELLTIAGIEVEEMEDRRSWADRRSLESIRSGRMDGKPHRRTTRQIDWKYNDVSRGLMMIARSDSVARDRLKVSLDRIADFCQRWEIIDLDNQTRAIAKVPQFSLLIPADRDVD